MLQLYFLSVESDSTFYFFFAFEKDIKIVAKFYCQSYKTIKCIENNVLRITKYFLKYSQQ